MPIKGDALLYLLDSDAARKLAQYDLVNELIAALNCQKVHLAVLPQLKYQLGLTVADQSKALKLLGNQQSLMAAKDLIAHAAEVDITPDAANPILQLNRPNLDSGEKTLLAALVSQPDDKLVSGDKKALVAISKINDIPILKGVWLRILCLEEAMHLIVRNHAFEDISLKIRARPDVDTAVSIIFGKSAANNYDNVIEGLNSFLRSLHKDTDGNYLPDLAG